MISFIEQTVGGDMEFFLAKKYNINYSEFLSTYPNNFQKDIISQWNEIESKITVASIFETNVTEKIHVVDIGDLDINKKTIKYLENVNNPDSIIYLYSGTKVKLLSSEKKQWEKAALEYAVTKKLTTTDISTIVKEYIQKSQVNIPGSVISEVISQSVDIREAINIVDFLSLCPDINTAWRETKNETKTLPFMMNFQPGNKTQINQWVKFANKDELQLALSIIFTKLQRNYSGDSKKAIAEVIEADRRIKNDNRVLPESWYKYMLWRIGENKY